jgi:S-DNA-T family DNA segregation ATPase FtsK/SpoIIIE
MLHAEPQGTGAYLLPSIDLLAPVPPNSGQAVDKAGLERNARLLETVLDDFHVKGRITQVRPGPVVTMYELEPDSGIKASRVIALADDIARNMSALSARVATIPGRTVIGIELPNVRREPVVLSELIASAAFQEGNGQLPIVLGKNIAGDPVIADLAPMPHLLSPVVTESQKASTSYVQRQLRICYNSAARLIERMEKEGKVGAPDHVGRREVLLDRDGQPV